MDYQPKFRIITNADFRKNYLFNPIDLVLNLQKTYEKNLGDRTKGIPTASSDRKRISFIFRKDINDEKIEAFLNDEEKKSEILREYGMKTEEKMALSDHAPIMLSIDKM